MGLPDLELPEQVISNSGPIQLFQIRSGPRLKSSIELMVAQKQRLQGLSPIHLAAIKAATAQINDPSSHYQLMQVVMIVQVARVMKTEHVKATIVKELLMEPITQRI